MQMLLVSCDCCHSRSSAQLLSGSERAKGSAGPLELRRPNPRPLPPALPLRSLTFFFALNALANYDPYQRWRIRLEYFARKLGCAEDLNSTDQYEGEG